MPWISERIGDLKISESISGQSSVDFEHLDAKIARRLKKIINGDFKRRVFIEAQQEKKFLTLVGRLLG